MKLQELLQQVSSNAASETEVDENAEAALKLAAAAD